MPTTIFTPDLAQAKEFLDAIDQQPGAKFGFRTIDDRGSDIRKSVMAYGNLERGVRQSRDPNKNGKPCCPARLISYMQQLQAGAFATINRLDGFGQKQCNVTEIRAVYVDCDSRSAVKGLRSFIAASGLHPSIEVESGGIHDGDKKIHAYWLIGCDVEQFRPMQLALLSCIGSDPAVQDPGRVMRLPGFYHFKAEAKVTRIRSCTGHKYNFCEFMERVIRQPQICNPRAVCSGASGGIRGPVLGHQVDTGSRTARLRALLGQHGGLVTPSVQALLREAKSPTGGSAGNRHQTLVAIACRCVKIGWSDDEVRQLVLPAAFDVWNVGSLELVDRLDRVLAWIRKQEAATTAASPSAVRTAQCAAPSGGSRSAVL